MGAVLKQVYIAESLAPPKSLNALTSSYKTLYSRVIDANYFPSIIKSGEWKKVGVYAVEAYGIFTIGEMVSEEETAKEAGISSKATGELTFCPLSSSSSY